MVEFAKLNSSEYEAALVIMDRAVAMADEAGIGYTRQDGHKIPGASCT